MVDIDAMRDLAQEVANEWGTLPDDVGLLEADFPALKELLGDVIPIIATAREPRGFATIANIERMVDMLVDVGKIVEYAPADYMGRDKTVVPVVEYKESPVLDIKIKSEPKTVSSGISKTITPDVVKRPAISSRLLDVSPLAAELVSVKEREGAVLSLSHTPEEYLAGVNDVTKSLLSDLQSIKGMLPADDNAMIYVPDDVLAGIQEKSAALGALIGTVQDSGELLSIKPETIAGLTGFAEELKRAEMLAATQDQYLHIQSVDSEGKGYPETEEEIVANYRKALAKYNPSGESDGSNEIIAKYFPGAIPGIIAKQADIGKIVDLCHAYEALLYGETTTKDATYVPGKGYVGKTITTAFSELSLDEQKDVICKFLGDGAETGTDPGYALSLIASLVETVKDDGRHDLLHSYLVDGGADKDLTAFASGRRDTDVIEWLQSRDAQMTIGAAFGIIGAVGGFAVAGPGGALVGIGMMPFATTEFANLYGMDPFRIKSELQAKGLYGPDIAYQYDQNYASVSDSIDMLKFQGDKLSPEKRKELIDQINTGLEKLGNQLGDNAVFLAAIREYDYELDRMRNLKDQYDLLQSTLDPTTGKWAVTTDEPARIVIKPPEGGTITSQEWGGTKDEDVVLHKDGEGSFTYEIRDKNDYLVGSKTVYWKNGESKEYDESEALADQTVWEENLALSEEKKHPIDPTASQFFGPRATPSETERGWTLLLNPGQKAEFAGKEYATTGENAAGFLFFDTPGKPLSIKFTNPDGAIDILNTFIPEDGYLIAQKEIAPSFISELEKSAAKQKQIADAKARAESVSYVVPTLTKGQVLYIDGKRVTPPADGSPIQVLPGDHSYVIKENGKQDVIGSFKVFGGDTYSVAGAGKAPYVSSSSGGGGGGGSSGGSRSSYTPTVKPAEPQTGFIKFTAAIEGASIELDNQEIAPEPGQSYEIAYGYHFLNILMPGKEAWAKQIYIGKGDTLTVSPLFADLEVEEEEIPPVVDLVEKKRVYINSNPSGAKVTINGTATGEWSPCYLDLLPGYYLVGFIKSGYAESQIALLVGDSISWGDLATSLAKMAGLV